MNLNFGSLSETRLLGSCCGSLPKFSTPPLRVLEPFKRNRSCWQREYASDPGRQGWRRGIVHRECLRPARCNGLCMNVICLWGRVRSSSARTAGRLGTVTVPKRHRRWKQSPSRDQPTSDASSRKARAAAESGRRTVIGVPSSPPTRVSGSMGSRASTGTAYSSASRWPPRWPSTATRAPTRPRPTPRTTTSSRPVSCTA